MAIALSAAVDEDSHATLTHDRDSVLSLPVQGEEMSRFGKSLSAMVAAAVVSASLFALPAGASGPMWTVKGNGIIEEKIELDGYYGFEVFGSGFECPVSAEATLVGIDSGEINSFAIGDCEWFGALLEGCDDVEAEAMTPWPLHLTGFEEPIAVEGFHTKITTDSGCPFNPIELIADGDVYLHPDSPTGISSLDLSGQATLLAPFGKLSNEVYGSFEVTPAGRIEIN